MDAAFDRAQAAYDAALPAFYDTCQGCGQVDPCGYHYADCPYLEPGDILVERRADR